MAITQNLIENFQKGDRDAFNTLYKELSSFIFNVIFRMVKTKEIAEELTHDVFIKLYDNRTTFNHSVKFETWSYRIAMNHTLNWLKRGQSLRSKLNQIVFKKYVIECLPIISADRKASLILSFLFLWILTNFFSSYFGKFCSRSFD